MIGFVYVTPTWRRKGLATALLKVTTEYADQYGLPVPRHTEERTPSGDAWARALGAEPARRIVDDPDVLR
jgi:GNAT superfamily N-acetyltransferase